MVLACPALPQRGWPEVSYVRRSPLAGLVVSIEIELVGPTRRLPLTTPCIYV